MQVFGRYKRANGLEDDEAVNDLNLENMQCVI